MRDLDDSVITDASEYDSVYFPGFENRLIRYYYYLNAGLGIVNNFRNVFLGIFGLYFILKLDNWALLIVMFIPTMVVLTIVGFFVVHRINKVQEWLGMRFSTHYGIRQFNYQQEQNELLKEIRDKL